MVSGVAATYASNNRCGDEVVSSPARRRLEQRLVHQVLDHVAAPDVEDDRHLGLQ
jgi:hypothetical protein